MVPVAPIVRMRPAVIVIMIVIVASIVTTEREAREQGEEGQGCTHVDARLSTLVATVHWCSGAEPEPIVRGEQDPYDVGTRLSATFVEYALNAGINPASAPTSVSPIGVIQNTGCDRSKSRLSPVFCHTNQAVALKTPA